MKTWVWHARLTVVAALALMGLAAVRAGAAEDELVLDAGQAPATDSLVDTIPALDAEPELIASVEAEYPPEVYKLGIEGQVVVDMLVSDSGTVDSVAVVKPLHPRLDSSAVVAARNLKFKPAMADSMPVGVILQYAFTFALQSVVEKIQSYVNLTGVVIERGTRKPVADAMVVARFIDTTADTSLTVPWNVYLQRLGEMKGQALEDGRLVAITDSSGAFAFRNLPSGPVEMTVPQPGYEEFYTRETIVGAESLAVVYYLRKVDYGDYEVVVYGKQEEKEVSRQQLTLTEIKKIPGVGNDAVRVVQALPGVARPTLGLSSIVVRGAPTSNSKFLLDGVEIPQGMLFHFGGISSTYNPDALQSIDFYPGGWGTRYGGAIGGVIELTGRPAKTDRWHAYADANLVDATIFAEGPIGDKVSVLGELRRSFIGNVIDLALGLYPSTTALTVAPFYWDYILRTDVNISKNQHAYLTFWGAKDETELKSSQVRGGSSDIDKAKNTARTNNFFHLGILGHDWTISDKLQNRLRLSSGYVEAETSVFGFFKTSIDYWQNHFRDQLTWTASRKLKINLGADVEFAPVDLQLTIPSGNNQIARDTTTDQLYGVIGGYLNCEWKPWDNVLIVPGFRYDYFPELTYNGAVVPEYWDYSMDNTGAWSGEPSLRLMARWEFVKKHSVKFAVGNYSQTPQPIALSIHPRWGDPTLGASRAAHYVLGYEWRITDLWNLSLEGYINRQWNVAQSVTDIPPFDDNDKLRMQGLELMLRHDMGGSFFGWLAYSLSRAEEFDETMGEWVPADKDQTHNLIVIAGTRLPKNWDVAMRLQYTTGDPYTPITDASYNWNYGFYEIEYGETNSDRMAPTFQLDLRIGKTWAFRKWMMEAYIGFININYFVYKSPQMYIPNFSDPYNPNTGEANVSTAYQFSLPSLGLKFSF